MVDNREVPSVTKSPLNMTVKLNDKVSLNCSATGIPTPMIRWYKDGKEIEGPQAIGEVFVIAEATPKERGFYHCEAFNGFGQPSISKEALILIQGWNITRRSQIYEAEIELQCDMCKFIYIVLQVLSNFALQLYLRLETLSVGRSAKSTLMLTL